MTSFHRLVHPLQQDMSAANDGLSYGLWVLAVGLVKPSRGDGEVWHETGEKASSRKRRTLMEGKESSLLHLGSCQGTITER